MSQVPDWNTPGGTPAYQQPPASQAYPQAAMVPAAGYGAPGVQVPPGMYYDQLSGLLIPEGTALATVGRRIGAYFLGLLLFIVTLGIGWIIWGLIAWAKGQTPGQVVLGMQTWKPQQQVNASWGTMFLRGLGWLIIGWVPFGQLVSFILFLATKEHRALHDSIAGTIVLHDPNKVLQQMR